MKTRNFYPKPAGKKINNKGFIFSAFIAAVLFSLTAVAQTYTRVNQYMGTTAYGAESVNVSSSGEVLPYSCGVNVGPYLVEGGGTNSFTFTFSSPVSALQIPVLFENFSESGQNISFTVNGTFYPITSGNIIGGDSYTCESNPTLAIASGGYLFAANGSGYSAAIVEIPGPVTSITISNLSMDNVVFGMYFVNVTPIVSLAGMACVDSTLTVTSNITPYQIAWMNGVTTYTTTMASWSSTGTVAAANGIADNGLSYITIDASGDLYAAVNGIVVMYPPNSTSGTAPTVVAENNVGYAVAARLDAIGNLYVADAGNVEILEFPPGSTSSTNGTVVAANGLFSPNDVFVDAAGNIYVADGGEGYIIKYPPGSTGPTAGTVVAQNGIGNPVGVFVDGSGNIYVSDAGNSEVWEFPPTSNASTTGTVVAQTGLTQPQGIYVDGQENLYVADGASFDVFEYPGGSNAGTTPVTLETTTALGNGRPTQPVLDANGNLYVGDNGGEDILKFANMISMTSIPASTGNYSAVVKTFAGGMATTNVVTVNITPSVNAVPGQAVCNNASTTVDFTGTSVPGTIFTWTNSNSSIGLATTGTGNVGPFAATNSGTVTDSAVFIVTPSIYGCVGVPDTFSIVVNPTPNVAAIPNQAACNGLATTRVDFSSAVSGTTFSWTNSNTNTGLAVSGTGDSILSFTATNGTNVPITSTVTVTPATSTCTGLPLGFVMTVNPTPTVNEVPDQTLCNNALTTVVNFSGTVTGTTYTWTNDNTNIGLGATNTGNIAPFTALNTTNATITGIIVVSPSFNGCVGAPQGFSINVNPSPNVGDISSQTLCSNTATTIITFSSTVAGTTFAWTNSNTNIGLGGSGNGNSIPSFTVTNTTTTPDTGIVIVTPSTSTCNGTPDTFIIIVNPLPVVPAITGNTTLSTGITTTLADATAGGVWASANTPVATIGSGSGVVSGVTTGTALISYTVTSLECSTTVTTDVTVNSPLSGLNFAGNDYVDIGTILSSGNSYTKEAWVYANATASNNIVSSTDYPFWVIGGQLSAANGYSSPGPVLQDPATFPIGQWVHVAVTYDAPSTTMVLYKNGVAVATNTLTPTYVGGDQQIGAYNAGNNWDGNIDEVRIWNVARTQSQIQANMNCDVAQQANLVAYYRFNEGIAGGNNTPIINALDYSGNGNCGQLNNFALTGLTSNFETGAIGSCNVIDIVTPGSNSGTAAVCSGFSTILSNSVPGGIWTSGNAAIATIGNTDGLVTGVSAGTVNMTYMLHCGTAVTTVTANLTPDVTPQLNQMVCNNTATTAVAFTGTVTPTTYNWTNSNVNIGLGVSGSVGIASFTATNGTNATDTGVIIVTPSTSTCTGAADTFMIIVYPTPNVVPEPGQTVCNGTTDSVSFSGTVNGTSYAWTNSNAHIGLETSGTGTTLFTAASGLHIADTGTIIVTPQANGCNGTPDTFTISVNPTPNVAATDDTSLCNGTLYSVTFGGSLVAGTSYLWTNSNTSTGLAASGTDTTGKVTLTNLTTATDAGTIIVTPQASGCNGIPDTFMINVYPTPMLKGSLTRPAICDNTVFSYGDTSLTAGTAFVWTMDAVSGISAPATSGADSINEVLSNSNTAQTAVTFVYTLTANGCVSTQSVVVTVNPDPQLSSPTTNTQCDSMVFSYQPSSFTGDSSFTWTRIYVEGSDSLGGSGTGAINDFLINNTSANVTDTYKYIITAYGCSDSELVTVMVHPTPMLSSATSFAVCSGQEFSYLPESLTGAAVTYSWIRDSVAGITPTLASGSGPIDEVLTKDSADMQVVTYYYTLLAYGCTNTENVYLAVNPLPVAPAITTYVADVCDDVQNQNFGVATLPPAGETYAWTATNANVTAMGGTGQYSLVNFTEPGTATVTITVMITGTGCSSSSTQNVTVGPGTANQAYVVYSFGEFVCLENNVSSYQWGYDSKATLDSTMLVGQINQNYANSNPDTIHNYYWVMTGQNGCIMKSYYNGPLASTAISNVNDVTDVTVYPNPTSNYINVDIKSTVAGDVTVELSNMLGQKLNEMPAKDNKAMIDVSSLAPGVYVIDCYREGIKIAAAKFIKN